MRNRIFSFLLAVVLLIGMIPLGVVAASANELDSSTLPSPLESMFGKTSSGNRGHATKVTASQSPTKANATYMTESEAASYLLSNMIARNTSVSFSFYANDCTTGDQVSAACDGLLEAAFTNFGIANAGDYLYYHVGRWEWNCYYSFSGSTCYMDITYTFEYFSNASQESQVDTKVSNLLSQWDLDGNTDYQKVKAIYDYMTRNIRVVSSVSNDYRELTAYYALVNGYSHSWGHSFAFYRLALELGLDARVILGESSAWNAVKIDGKWYYLDTSMDYGKSTYSWFLKGSNQFYNHVINEDIYAYRFPNGLSVSADDYVYDAVKSNIVITTQPKNVTVEPGKTAKVTVKAKGEGLTYQWYFKDPGKSSFSKSSVTKSSYSFEMENAKSGRQVYCKITDAYGNTLKTKTVTMKMKGGIVITAQPKTGYAKSGKTVKVSVEAEGSGLKYQWYIRNADKDSYSKSSVTEATYSCKMNSTSKDRRVYCVITDKNGNSVKTDTVVLRMAATITTQPKDATAATGETVKVSVKAAGDDLKYQWYVKNADSDSFSKSSITKSTYSVEMSNKVNGRQVYCKVTDKYGKTAKSETVTLKKAPALKITTQPKSVTVANGETAKVTVKATGNGVKYQWYVMNAGKTAFSKSSVTKATYSVEMSKSVSGRQVYCVVTDKSGKKLTTDVVTLNMTSAPKITTHPKSKAVANGDIVELSVAADGSGLKYKWFFKDPGQSEFSKSTNTKSTYTFRMDDNISGRNVFCVITDSSGRSSTTKTAVISQITITTQPKAVSGEAGETIKTKVKAEGSGLKYQWYVKDPDSDSFSKSSITEATYSCKITKSISGRQVYCKITDKYGNSVKTKTVKLTVE